MLKGIFPDHCRELFSVDPLLLDRNPGLKISGMGWNTMSVHFFYAVRMTDTAETKRTVSNQMAKIFDPLGWLAPVTFSGKLFFRQFCQLNLDWDQGLPNDLNKP